MSTITVWGPSEKRKGGVSDEDDDGLIPDDDTQPASPKRARPEESTSSDYVEGSRTIDGMSIQDWDSGDEAESSVNEAPSATAHDIVLSPTAQEETQNLAQEAKDKARSMMTVVVVDRKGREVERSLMKPNYRVKYASRSEVEHLITDAFPGTVTRWSYLRSMLYSVALQHLRRLRKKLAGAGGGSTPALNQVEKLISRLTAEYNPFAVEGAPPPEAWVDRDPEEGEMMSAAYRQQVLDFLKLLRQEHFPRIPAYLWSALLDIFDSSSVWREMDRVRARLLHNKEKLAGLESKLNKALAAPKPALNNTSGGTADAVREKIQELREDIDADEAVIAVADPGPEFDLTIQLLGKNDLKNTSAAAPSAVPLKSDAARLLDANEARAVEIAKQTYEAFKEFDEAAALAQYDDAREKAHASALARALVRPTTTDLMSKIDASERKRVAGLDALHRFLEEMVETAELDVSDSDIDFDDARDSGDDTDDDRQAEENVVLDGIKNLLDEDNSEEMTSEEEALVEAELPVLRKAQAEAWDAKVRTRRKAEEGAGLTDGKIRLAAARWLSQHGQPATAQQMYDSSGLWSTTSVSRLLALIKSDPQRRFLPSQGTGLWAYVAPPPRADAAASGPATGSSAAAGSASACKPERLLEVPYKYEDQAVAVAAITRNAQKNVGLILSGAMGWGKTVVSLKAAVDVARTRCVIIVCPSSNTKDPWEKEIRRFTGCGDENDGVVVVGTKFTEPSAKTRFLIMSYGVAEARLKRGQGDQPTALEAFIESGRVGAVILDEAHRVRNTKPAQASVFTIADRVLAVGADKKAPSTVIAATGTPFVNERGDIVPLCRLVNARTSELDFTLDVKDPASPWHYLGRQDAGVGDGAKLTAALTVFKENFYFSNTLAVTRDVQVPGGGTAREAVALATKYHDFEMTEFESASFFKALMSNEPNKVNNMRNASTYCDLDFEDFPSTDAIHGFKPAELTWLAEHSSRRKACEKYADQLAKRGGAPQPDMSEDDHTQVQLLLRLSSLVHARAIGADAGTKIKATVGLVDTIMAERSNRVLVFSQMLEPLRLVKHFLDVNGRVKASAVISGKTSQDERDDWVSRLSKVDHDPDRVDVALMSLTSSAEGTNIQSANHVIFMDTWWNESMHRQAIARAYRSGQLRDVTVHYMVPHMASGCLKNASLYTPGEVQDSLEAYCIKTLFPSKNIAGQQTNTVQPDVVEDEATLAARQLGQILASVNRMSASADKTIVDALKTVWEEHFNASCPVNRVGALFVHMTL